VSAHAILRRARAAGRSLIPVLGIVLLVLVWQLVHAARVADPVLLPSPGEALRALWAGFISGPMADDFVQTVWRTALSFLIASAIALPLGVVLGASAPLYRSVEFIIDFFRSTPASAMFPLFLVLFGIADRTKIYVASFGAALAIVFSVAYGVMNTRKTRILAAQSMGASRMRILRDVVFWDSLPQTFVGLRNGISIALVIIIVAEMFIGSSNGLGHRLIEAQMLFNMPTMYAAIFAAGALGYGMNLLFLGIERRFVHWSGR
jgi:ABC-type nitrate/sulfonate/bicarbonate transport system permease component